MGGTDVYVVFLDFANAFGSVPHNALIDAVLGAGAGDHFGDIVNELYNTTAVVGGDGATEPIRIDSGIRKECPLSGLLFNLVVDPIIRAVQEGNGRPNILPYADDLTPMANDRDTLQQRICVQTFTQLGLQLNPAKCKTLHMSGKPVGTCPTTFHVGALL